MQQLVVTRGVQSEKIPKYSCEIQILGIQEYAVARANKNWNRDQ